jgi:hypothetical protein
LIRNSHPCRIGQDLARLFLARHIDTLARQLYTAVMAKTKHRSPNYPRLAFDSALEKTRAIYAQQHKHSASRDVIAQALGYTTFNGASKAVITALKHYGLLEPAGDGLRVSADAIRVIELPQGDPEWTTALVRMVFAPSVFADLRSKYGEPLPLSIRRVLVTQEFAPHAADEIIRVYRANFEFVRDHGGDAGEPSAVGQVEQKSEALVATASEPSRGRLSPETSPDRVLQFQIAEDTDARIHFRGRPNRPAIKKLIALLELSADTFPA